MQYRCNISPIKYWTYIVFLLHLYCIFTEEGWEEIPVILRPKNCIMARLKNKGNLSGAIGNIVFVNDGQRVFVRSVPDTVKQSERTKVASKVFGLVSAKEKGLRRHLLQALGMPALQYLAAKHRGRLQKTVVADGEGNLQFGTPEALAGFEFNPHLEWSRCTNFFPVVKTDNNGTMEVMLPELKWGQQIKAPKNATSARLKLCAVAVDMNSENLTIKTVSEVSFSLSRYQSADAQTWSFTQPNEGWLLVLGSLYFEGAGSTNAECFSGCYLWVGTGKDVV